jgi:hypothetical protein
MRIPWGWLLACGAAVALQAGAASAEGLVDPRICKRAELSDEARAYCDRIAGLRGRDLFKATALANLRGTNKPPVADLELAQTLPEVTVLPGRVDLDASGSTDEDGFPKLYTFQLFDDATGQVLAGPLMTRQPVATLHVDRVLRASLRATVVVEDDERATDITDLAIDLGDIINCSNTFLTCSSSAGLTSCSPTSGNGEFSTG